MATAKAKPGGAKASGNRRHGDSASEMLLAALNNVENNILGEFAKINRRLKAIEQEQKRMSEDVIKLQQQIAAQQELISGLPGELSKLQTNIANEIQQVLDAVNRGSVDREAIRQAALSIQQHNEGLGAAVASLQQANAALTADDAPAAGGGTGGGNPEPAPGVGGGAGGGEPASARRPRK